MNMEDVNNNYSDGSKQKRISLFAEIGKLFLFLGNKYICEVLQVGIDKV